jgi:hypothetical protein
MNIALHPRQIALLVSVAPCLLLAGCATVTTDAAPPKDAVIVETKSVLVTGSHIPVRVPKNPIARPEPTLAPVVTMTVSDTVPFQGPGATPVGPISVPSGGPR